MVKYQYRKILDLFRCYMDGTSCRRSQWRLGVFLVLMMVCETWLIYVVMEAEHRAAHTQALARSGRDEVQTTTLEPIQDQRTSSRRQPASGTKVIKLLQKIPRQWTLATHPCNDPWLGSKSV